jgi:hypothetical protein
MAETWIQLMEQLLGRKHPRGSRGGNYWVPGCFYGALDLDENYEPTPERIAAERLTESTYHEITHQLEVAWGPPDFQGDGAESALRGWEDATRLAYWEKGDDLAVVAIQAEDNTRLYSLTLSVRFATKLARRARAYREMMAQQIALESERRERAFQDLMAQRSNPDTDPRWVQVVWGGWPQP